MAQPQLSGASDPAPARNRRSKFAARAPWRWKAHYAWTAGTLWTALTVLALIGLHRGEIAEVGLGEFAVLLGLWGAGVLALIGGHHVARSGMRERAQMIAALRASEAGYRQLFEHNPSAMFVYDLATLRLLAANAAAQRQYGYAPEEFPQLTLWELHPPAERDRLEATLRTDRPALASSGPWTHVRRDGSPLRVEINSHALQWEGRSARCVIATDISEQQRLNAAVEEQAITYQALLSAALDGVMELDEAGRVIAANEAFLATIGSTMPELATRRVAELEASETAEEVQRHLAHIRLAGRGRFETRLRGRDGQLIDFEVNAVHVPGRGRFVSILRDITARNRATEALRESEAALNAAQRVAGVGSWKWQIATDRLEWSDEMYRIFGVDREQFTGRLQEVIATAIHPDDRAAVVAANRAVVVEGRPEPVEYRVVHPDGSVRRVWAEAGELVRDAAGRAVQLTGIVQDVTERRRMEEALEKRLVALTGPGDAAEGIEFDQLFDLAEIQRLQDQFATATGVASIITRPDGTPITQPSNFRHFCAGIVRQTEKGRCHCMQSDAVLGRCHPSGPVVQRCLSGGLWDAGASIVVGGRHVANWLIGQVRDETQDAGSVCAYAEEIGADPAALQEAFRQVPCMSREQFEQIAQTLFTLAQQLSSMAYQNVQQARFITERDRAEQALRRSEERFREAIEHTGAGYFRIDRTGRYEAVNRAWLAMHGFARAEEVVGRSFQTTQAAEDGEAAAAIVRRVLAGERVAPGEFRRQRADGSFGYHTFSVHPVHRGSEIVAIEGFLIDTTPLRQAMADYKMLFDTMLDGFALHEIVRDEQGRPVDLRYTAVNPAFERQTGIRGADVVGRRMSEAIPGLEPVWMETYRRVAETGEPAVFESFSQPLNRYFKVSAFRPSANQLVCVFADLTARRLAEIELRKLSRAVEQSPVSVIITDPAGAIEYVNPWFTNTTGYTLEEVRGKNPRLLSSGETPAATYREMWQSITAGRDWRGEFHNRRKDGTPFWEAVTIGPIFDEQGKITRFLAVKEDITERKRASERIREQAALLDVAHDGILVTTLDGVVSYWNRAAERMYGIAAAEALGRPLDELIPPQDAAAQRQEWQRLVELGEWSGERQHPVRRGGTIDVRVHATVVRNPADRPASVLLVVTDITASKRMEKQFLRAQRIESLGALASGVAHDLNNVLTPILMAVELLRPLAQTAADRDMLQLLGDSARRGSDIVQQLLLFGRGSDSPRVQLNVAGILKDTARLMRETFPKNILQSVQAPADLWLVEADRTQVHQVVLNLCVNARDAMPEGGRLQIAADNLHVDDELAQRHAAKPAGRYVRITVRDTGAGITPENLDKIFDPFFTTKPVGQGTGLGLATVLGIVRGHGGFVDVVSRPGEGATFEVYLPAAAVGSEAAGEAPAQGALRGRGELVLVVEDEEAIRSLLQRALTAHNYRVLVASDGAEALGVYAHHSADIDLVITDAMMPVMDGAQMVRALRRLNPALPVIAISGLPSQRAELEKNPGLPVHFLPKPFATDQALGLVRQVLDAPADDAPPPAVPA